MRKRLVNHKILSVNDCLVIVSNLFISIVTTNNDSPSFLLRVSMEATMPQKGMAWKAAENTRGKGNPLLHQSLREVVFTKTPPPPGPLLTLIFHCWNDFSLSRIIQPRIPIVKEHLLLMFVSSNPTVKRPPLHTWKKDLRTNKPPSSLPPHLWAVLRSST